jgi:uncharacterized protein (DUF697 family)/GTP-binding protein EngB required for normal cell division
MPDFRRWRSPRSGSHDLGSDRAKAFISPLLFTKGVVLIDLSNRSVPRTPSEVLELVRASLADARRDLGRFNLLIVGNTGAGKSTLINAMFGWQIAKTGIGRPVTDTTREYEHLSLPLTVLDTRGCEMGEDTQQLTARLVAEIERRQDLPVEQQIHVAWYCIRANDRRLDPGQEAVIRAIAATGVPVILVLTQVGTRDRCIHPDTVEFVAAIRDMDLPLSPEGRGIAPTAAVDDPWFGPAHGLPELLDLTFEVIPKGAENALSAAQQVDFARKRTASQHIVFAAAGMAGAAAAVPIPFADAAALIPIQVAMMAKVATVWGFDIETGALISLIGGVFLCGGATQVGRYLARNFLKMVPFVGSVVNAGVAAALTTTIGMAWTCVVERFANDPEALARLSREQLRGLLMAEMRPIGKSA